MTPGKNVEVHLLATATATGRVLQGFGGNPITLLDTIFSHNCKHASLTSAFRNPPGSEKKKGGKKLQANKGVINQNFLKRHPSQLARLLAEYSP
jgi:hypothetical protein